MRAVLDPNVIISGLLSRSGSPALVLLAWQRAEFDLVASPLLLDELERALAYPKIRRHVPAETAEGVMRWIGDAADVVEDPEGEPPVRSNDPGDDYLIALAAVQRAVLVSGDKHLLGLAGRIPVYSPKEFLDLVSSP